MRQKIVWRLETKNLQKSQRDFYPAPWKIRFHARNQLWKSLSFRSFFALTLNRERTSRLTSWAVVEKKRNQRKPSFIHFGTGDQRSCGPTVTHQWCFCGMQNTVKVASFMIHSECSKPDKGSIISYYFIVIRVNLRESAVSTRADGLLHATVTLKVNTWKCRSICV